MIILTAIMQAVAGKGDDVEREFKKLTPKVLKDPGAVTYIVHRAVDDPNKFLVYEQYENDDAFKYHVQTDHYQAFRQGTKGMFIGKTEVTLYNKVA
ncbi:MAG: putative quinol monooxygenase [Dehalococcoidales bacterium]